MILMKCRTPLQSAGNADNDENVPFQIKLVHHENETCYASIYPSFNLHGFFNEQC